MSETKFTPGPWEWWKNHSGDLEEPLMAGEEHVLEIYAGGGDCWLSITQEDAHLIAVAPEQNNALERLVALLWHVDRKTFDESFGVFDSDYVDKLWEAVVEGGRVLAKARGETL